MINAKNLTLEQRHLAVQRLTALWAFSESGLGGVLHALQVPFTGLVVGGMAIVLISFISHLAPKGGNEVLKSLVVVLLIKALVSPHTPFPAYIAVGFQGLLGYTLFRLFGVQLFSILFLSVLAMVESAIQKLLVLTLFFGQAFWKALDELVRFIGKQFSIAITGSYWLVIPYLMIYVAGGIAIAIMTYKMLFHHSYSLQPSPQLLSTGSASGHWRRNRAWQFAIILGVSVTLSSILYLLAPDGRQAISSVVRAIIWTLTAILVWYGLLTPIFSRLLQYLLQKNRSRYSHQLEATLTLLPVLRSLTVQAWQGSKPVNGWRRIPLFVKTLLSWSLTYTDNQNST